MQSGRNNSFIFLHLTLSLAAIRAQRVLTKEQRCHHLVMPSNCEQLGANAQSLQPNCEESRRKIIGRSYYALYQHALWFHASPTKKVSWRALV